MNLGQVIEIFEFATGRVNPGETYLVNQMREAIVFLTDLEARMPVLANTIKVEVPKARPEHPSKTDKNWVRTFQRIVNRLVSCPKNKGEDYVSEQMIREYFSDDENSNSNLQEHVAMYNDTDLMGIEVIEMVEQAVTDREFKD